MNLFIEAVIRSSFESLNLVNSEWYILVSISLSCSNNTFLFAVISSVTSVVSTISGWFGHFISFESQFGPLNQKSFSLTIEIPLVPRILGKDFGQLVRNAM